VTCRRRQETDLGGVVVLDQPLLTIPLVYAVLLPGSEDWRTPHLGNRRARIVMLDIEEDAR
jgi:hypothetical protein